MSDPSHAHYVDQRRVDEATVTLIGDGFVPMPILRGLSVPEETWRRAVPEASARGETILTVQVAHLAVGGASILVDVGLGEPLPGAPWTEPHVHRTPGVRAGLAAVGVRPEDVTHVLLTHAHPDHVAGLTADGRPRFPNARVLVGRAEWEGSSARANPASPAGHHLGAIERAGLLDLVDGGPSGARSGHEVVPGVTMLPAPGESPGHMVVRLRSGGETFFFLGDLVHHPCQFAHPDWVLEGRDRDATLATRAHLFGEAAATGATLAFTHGLFPAWGRLAADGDAHRWVTA